MKMRNALSPIVAALAFACLATSCTTTYDAYGRPVQSVDPALAVAGIAAAGLVGYALADDNDWDHSHYRSYQSYRPYRNPPRYYGPYNHYRHY